MRDRAERGRISWPVPSTFLVPLSWSHLALCLIPSHHRPPVPSCLSLPVQLMGVGVQFSPSKRIISSEMYIPTHVLHGFLGRQGPGARTAGQRGLITRLSNLNWSPPRMGMLMAPEVLAPQKSIAAALHTLPPSCLLCPFHLGFKCRSESHHRVIWFPMPADGPARGAAAGKWGAWEQGLGCAPGGMATGSTRCVQKMLATRLRGGRGGEACSPAVEGRRRPGGRLSCEQMASAEDIALGGTQWLPRNKGSRVRAPERRCSGDAGASMQGPSETGLSSKL